MTKELQMTELDALRAAWSRQADNMAFVLNNVALPQPWYDKFTAELAADRAAWNTRTPAKVAGVDVDALKATFAKATQGEWLVKTVHDPIYGKCPWIVEGPEGDQGGSIIECGLVENPEANAAAIVALHNAFPALIAKIEADAARIAALEGALRECQSAAAMVMQVRGLATMTNDAELRRSVEKCFDRLYDARSKAIAALSATEEPSASS